ncbi:ATP-grasp peptide maturase system methyltransferase [Streptomyces acidiscabies]|uniref:Protein-L-isoaspartate O-methyltransferase n=1 Tax=Streptomyces acidiscabies TaxID=42234 RepID=A0A0L0JEP6_9ACTN|nr:ATP-grasp peptide maturase system methyltransferase [Streptomyces acidiscabies]KND23830.1 SAM-dependent methlyltransferase [Streptomyces acidiscabies]
MTTPAIDTDAAGLRAHLAQALADDGVFLDPAWRTAVEKVPRHRFVPGFYLPGERPSPEGLTVWQPVTAATDYGRWLAGAYSDDTLITQFDGTEPDWDNPAERTGGAPTSSSTLPSLVVRMWNDADIHDGDQVLEVGSGTGYATALACERLGAEHVTSIEVDPHRLAQAAQALYSLDHIPGLAVADGLYGYRPSAPFDRIVAACSFRTIPGPWLAQTRPGGKILTTLGGWLHGHARVLATINGDGTASGPLLPGTISFMAARTQEPPAFGNPAHWGNLLSSATRTARHTPDRITAGTPEAFFTRFLVQCAIPDAQLSRQGSTLHLIDAVSGSVARLTQEGDTWRVREGGPLRLWDKAETILTAYDQAHKPAPETFQLDINPTGQYLRHPQLPGLRLHAG